MMQRFRLLRGFATQPSLTKPSLTKPPLTTNPETAKTSFASFPPHLDETPRAKVAPHSAFPSAFEAKRQRIAAFGAAFAITAVLLGVAVLHNETSESQVEAFRKHQGVSVWGAKKPLRRIDAFEQKSLRDLAFAKDTHASIVAVDATGSLSILDESIDSNPIPTLLNANIERVAVSKDQIIALTKSGQLFTIDLIKTKQLLMDRKAANLPLVEPIISTTSWHFGLLGSPIAGPVVDASALSKVAFQLGVSAQRIVSITAGDHHAIALSSSGKVFSLPTSSSTDASNSLGQLGLGEDSTLTPALDTLYPIVTPFNNSKVVQIASGSAFNCLRTADGDVFAWGSNRFGQLGTGNKKKDIASSSTPLKMGGEFVGPSKKCVEIAAGGDTAVFVVEEADSTEVYSVGMGLWGQLGVGRFLHLTNPPLLLPTLSHLSEFSTPLNRVVPLRFSAITLGPSHAVAVLNTDQGEPEVYGRDVYAWGKNDEGQLAKVGGGRGNVCVPGNVAVLEEVVVGESLVLSGEEEVGATTTSGSGMPVWEGKNGSRLQVAGPGRVVGSKGKMEQAVVCGEGVTAVYARIC
ncbi:hypothetical protein HDU98_007447 [Podochytrium sp. JEL0797]|nr:hypothetical protein HDU98_007447 [Podochytrium sp. JEL0797]